MPNHLHCILIVGAPLAGALIQADALNQTGKQNMICDRYRAGASPAPTEKLTENHFTIGKIIGSFKSICANFWLKYINYKGINETSKFWQRNYYEHIIRDDDELNRIREYIANNPANWLTDENNPAMLKTRLKF